MQLYSYNQNKSIERGDSMKQCVKQNIIFLMLLTAVSLCSCGSKRSIYRNEEHLYFYNGQSYKNDGEIFLSEKETEYVELIEEIPEGIEGAEWHNQFYQYADWLLLGINGERYFLLLQYSEKSREEHERPAGTPAYIYYNDELYGSSGEKASEDIIESMDAVGFIQSFVDSCPSEDFQANTSVYVGHLLFEYEEKLVISGDGGEGYAVYTIVQQ